LIQSLVIIFRLVGLSTELAVNFSVIAFRFFSEKEREGKYLRAVSRNAMKGKIPWKAP
jgi:hypothetical protein